MRTFKNPRLQNIMEQIDEGLASVTEQLKQSKDTDAFLFLRTFRDELWRRGVSRDRANTITAQFDLELSDGILDEEDLIGAAEQYAEWTVDTINTIQECSDDDLLDKIFENINLELRFE